MHTALVSRLLRERSLWEETHISGEGATERLSDAEEASSLIARS